MKKWLILPLVVVGLGAGYTVFWNSQAKKLEEKVPLALQAKLEEIDPGAVLNYKNVKVTGFPLAFEVALNEAQVELSGSENLQLNLDKLLLGTKITGKQFWLKNEGMTRVQCSGSALTLNGTWKAEGSLLDKRLTSIESQEEFLKQIKIAGLAFEDGEMQFETAGQATNVIQWNAGSIQLENASEEGMIANNFSLSIDGLRTEKAEADRIHEDPNLLATFPNLEGAMDALAYSGPHSLHYTGHLEVSDDLTAMIENALNVFLGKDIPASLEGMRPHFAYHIQDGWYANQIYTDHLLAPFKLELTTTDEKVAIELDVHAERKYVKGIAGDIGAKLYERSLVRSRRMLEGMEGPMAAEQLASIELLAATPPDTIKRVTDSFLDMVDNRLENRIKTKMEIELTPEFSPDNLTLPGVVSSVTLDIDEFRLDLSGTSVTATSHLKNEDLSNSLLPKGEFKVTIGNSQTLVQHVATVWNEGFRDYIKPLVNTEGYHLKEMGEQEVNNINRLLDWISDEPEMNQRDIPITLKIANDSMKIGTRSIPEVVINTKLTMSHLFEPIETQ